MYKNPLPFLGLPRQRELGKELSESHVQRVPFEAEVSQVFFGYRSTKVVAAMPKSGNTLASAKQSQTRRAWNLTERGTWLRIFRDYFYNFSN